MRCQNPRWVCPKIKPEQVPCGKCLPCLTNKRNDWAFRLDQEYKRSQGAAFVTLTYHPKFCPDFGLSKRHLQLYIKRLRKAYGKKLRYFAVGEYGTKHNRPHYHLIIFNYGEKDARLDKLFEQSWSTRTGESFGIVDIRPVNYARIMYCTKYVIQSRDVRCKSRTDPFMLCSRAYGLGAHYLTDAMVKWHREGKRNFTLVFGEKRRLPRYYKEKIWYPLRKPKAYRRGDSTFYTNEYPAHYEREIVSMASKAEGIIAEEKNLQMIRDAGYSDPDAILAEMRSAVISRIKQKVAFTQIL